MQNIRLILIGFLSIIQYAFAATYTCSNADQVSTPLKMGNWGSSSSSLKDTVIIGAKTLETWASSSVSDTSRTYTNGSVIGMVWLGNMVQNSGEVSNLIERLIINVNSAGISDAIFIEYVVNGDPAKTVGIIFDTTKNTTRVYNAIKSWSEGKSLTGYTSTATWNNGVTCYLSYANRKKGNTEPRVGTCDYIRVTSGMNLESATGVTADALTLYNPTLDFSNLSVGTPICYSVGSAPDLRKSQNSDGSCYTYTVVSGDSCSSIAATYYPLSVSDIVKYNNGSYAWGGSCSALNIGDKVCVSSGTQPRPTSISGAVCGPYAPGDSYLKSCPLSACCSKYGSCGYTADYCDSSSGCFSNCSYGSLSSDPVSSTFTTSAYWLDTNTTLHYNVSLIDGVYDIIYYSFATINSDYSLSVGTDFTKFKTLTKSKKILSVGGWDFSTGSSTYSIFRSAINSTTFLTNVKNFVTNNGLDGVNFDWEYPAESNIPGIPDGASSETTSYTSFVKNVRAQLPSSSISLAIPANYWFLKGFELKLLSSYADYFVLMNYDYYGQWDYGTKQTGCHVDKTLTNDSLEIINKAGVPFSKIHGGLANYARTYQLVKQNCDEYSCDFTGPSSGAQIGSISNTIGVLTENELLAIPRESRTRWTDSDSWCDILVYDNGTNWAGWIKKDNRVKLASWYKSIGLGGTVLWAANYELTKPGNV